MEDLRNDEGSEFFTRSSAIVTSSSTRPTKLPLRQAVYFDIIDKYPKVPKARPSTSGNRQELRPLRKGRLELNYIPRQPSAGHQEGNNNIRPGFSFETYNISTKELRRLHLLNVRKGYMVYNIDPQDPEDRRALRKGGAYTRPQNECGQERTTHHVRPRLGAIIW